MAKKSKDKFAVIVEKDNRTYNLGTVNSVKEADKRANKFLKRGFY